MMRFLLACAACAACASGARPMTAGKPAPTCEAVRDHLVALLPASDHAPKEKLAEIGERFRVHCRDDSWSVETRGCLVDATVDTLKRCAELLTPAQQQALAGDAASPAPPKAQPPAESKPKQDSSDPCEGGQ